MLSGDIPPNQTVYIKNLNDKVKKEELRRSLYALFSQFGRILDVVALKTPKLRGQAWVVFSEITAASNAFRQMQNFPFYDKPIGELCVVASNDKTGIVEKRIQYAKEKSDCVAKADGTFDKKKKKQEEKGERKRKAEDSKPSAPSSQSNGATGPNQGGKQAPTSGPAGEDSGAPPNNVLFIENLPHETTSMMLQILFQQYPGFREVRMIPAKPGIAFVEFTDDSQSAVAMQALQGFKITPQFPMSISFAKK